MQDWYCTAAYSTVVMTLILRQSRPDARFYVPWHTKIPIAQWLRRRARPHVMGWGNGKTFRPIVVQDIFHFTTCLQQHSTLFEQILLNNHGSSQQASRAPLRRLHLLAPGIMVSMASRYTLR